MSRLSSFWVDSLLIDQKCRNKKKGERKEKEGEKKKNDEKEEEK